MGSAVTDNGGQWERGYKCIWTADVRNLAAFQQTLKAIGVYFTTQLCASTDWRGFYYMYAVGTVIAACFAVAVVHVETHLIASFHSTVLRRSVLVMGQRSEEKVDF